MLNLHRLVISVYVHVCVEVYSVDVHTSAP